MEYLYKCPKCEKEIVIKKEETYNNYIENNLLCYACRQKEKNLNLNLVRVCPKCGKILHYKWKSDYKKANTANSACSKCTESNTRFKNGIYKETPVNTPTYTLNKILDMSIESFYWLGLIVSDGSFYRNCFDLSLSEKDYEYLKEFAEYINYNVEKIKYRQEVKSFRISFNNKNNILKFKEIFGILDRKTYNPIDYDEYIKKYTYEQKFALLIGIIDGDGNIYKCGKRFVINITAHKCWESFYRKLINDLNIDFHIRHINNTNVITIYTGKKENVYNILKFAKDNNIIKLKRKWEKIN